MRPFDLVVRGGTVVTGADVFRADIGIVGERIAAIGEDFDGTRVIDATGKLVLRGSDADLVFWDAERRVTLTNALMQYAIDYTPYEGLGVTGWPVMTIARSRLVMEAGTVTAAPGAGLFLESAPTEAAKPRGVVPDGFDAARI